MEPLFQISTGFSITSEKFAVLTTWNSNNYYVDFFVSKNNELKVWVGEAASQQTTENCILPGGNRQIWIALKDIQNLKKNIKLRKISWPFNTLN